MMLIKHIVTLVCRPQIKNVTDKCKKNQKKEFKNLKYIQLQEILF